jgi:hypothetical protein
MNTATKEKFAAHTSKDVTAGNACLETPPAVFVQLVKTHGPFDIDLTADTKRHLCPVWFGPGSLYDDDALTAAWTGFGKTGYSNPPYGPFVAMMLEKAKKEATYGFTTTLLLPVRITKAFHHHVLYGATEVLFCDKRIAFWENGAPKLDPKTGKPTGALFDSMIVRYIPGIRFSPPRVGSWKVPAHNV